MSEEKPIVAVIGAGSWGTALAKLMADQGYETRLWSRRADQAAMIEERRTNPDYLRDVPLPPPLHATSDLAAAVRDADLVIVVVPTEANRALLADLVPLVPAHVPIVSATKGIEQGSLKLVSEVFEELFPKERHRMLTYLGGPSFAHEVARGVPTAVSIAGHDEAIRQQVQRYFNTDRFRVYTTEDVTGVEVGGALKNVIAIAAGIADGMKLGHNTRAALITRGLAELSRLALTLGANPLTLAGLSGMGDLVLTCTGDLSRNRRVGMELGQGRKLPEILKDLGMVAEGVQTAKSAHELALKLDVDMPITHAVYSVLYQDKPAQVALVELMTRPLKEERS
ncbi:MAG: NAD(P)-dependent glycerol-3-phosphate dehydrogenase [Myxococcales bacterium]|nr:NAD(P)-dependent glycerol-3-phosphate dehydrogenase [Myxococcales bacterium]